MPQFKEGDIVQLKSGGPRMTYTGINNSAHGLLCKWFTGSKVEEGWFQASLLKLATDERQQS